MRTIWRAVLREHIGPFFFAFAVVFFILVLDLLIDVMDSILGKGIAVGTVLQLFVLNFAWIIALAVPMAVLVSVLMAFARLANDNEITALMAVGISPSSLVVPSVVAGGFVAAGLMWFNNAVLPESNFRARVLLNALREQKPAISLKNREGQFITDFPGYVLRVDRVMLESPGAGEEASGSRLEGILIYQFDQAGGTRPTVVTAKSGTIEIWDGGATVRLVLNDGEMSQVDSKNPESDIRTQFKRQTIIIADRQRGNPEQLRRAEGFRGDRELSSAAMLERARMYDRQVEAVDARIASLVADTGMAADYRRQQIASEERVRQGYRQMANQYRVEIHKKFSIPVACIVFVLIGAPLGMMARGTGRSVAIVASLVLFLLYWASLIAGEQLADRGFLPPWLAMWGANIIIGLWGIALLFSVTWNVRMASLMELVPRAIEARRSRKASSSAAKGFVD
ncbi:MAG TPA: LptF/LptG family permease [Candidatus Latescibacteria bacterium]|nr:LptF/LptG family permease [Candidatus Latescibacterota bacterium]